MRLCVALASCVLLVACHRKHHPTAAAESVVAQGARACAAMKDGTVRCWGRDGQRPVLRPTPLAGAAGVASVCVGADFECALGKSGEVSCLGATVRGASDVACGDHHACALVSGEIVCWERGVAPKPVPGPRDARAISAGGGTTCAVLGEGTAVCWGAGKRGQLGSGAFADSATPIPVPGLHVRSISVGREHTCAVLRDETIACFGADDDGELGDGHTEASAKPVTVMGIAIARQVACGAHHTCAQLGDSTVRCWGKNDVHQSSLADSADVFTPTLVSGLYEATAVAAGDDFTCAKMQDGWVRCFGVNDWGQLGDGTTTIRNVPTPIKF